jgi:hypothetical protein
LGRELAVPGLCELYPGIFLTTEEKHVKPSEVNEEFFLLNKNTQG